MGSYSGFSDQQNVLRRAFVTQVDIDNLQCTVQERGGGPIYVVTLNSAPGAFFTYPNVGEEWIICRLESAWTLYRRSSYQNPAIATLYGSNPGDVIFSASGDFKFDKQITQPINTCTFINTSPVISGGEREIGAPGRSKLVGAEFAKVVGRKIQITKTGVYAVAFGISAPNTGVGRAFLTIQTSGGYYRRGYWSNDDTGWLESSLPITAGEMVTFAIYHSYGSDLTVYSRIDITQVG